MSGRDGWLFVFTCACFIYEVFFNLFHCNIVGILQYSVYLSAEQRLEPIRLLKREVMCTLGPAPSDL